MLVAGPSIGFGKETNAIKPVTVTSGDPEIIVQCLGLKAKSNPSNSVRVYVHYRITNNSPKEKFGILDFKAHCPFQNELTDLEGGFVFNSPLEGIIGFLFPNLNKLSSSSIFGIYLEILFFSDKLLKKNFTILSSKE